MPLPITPCSPNQLCPSVGVRHQTGPGTYDYRACATDGMGNVSAGVTRSISIR